MSRPWTGERVSAGFAGSSTGMPTSPPRRRSSLLAPGNDPGLVPSAGYGSAQAFPSFRVAFVASLGSTHPQFISLEAVPFEGGRSLYEDMNSRRWPLHGMFDEAPIAFDVSLQTLACDLMRLLRGRLRTHEESTWAMERA